MPACSALIYHTQFCAQLLYTVGTVGGSYYNQGGSASNYLCMPADPIYDEYVDGSDNSRARLYTSEYQTGGAPNRLQSRANHTPTCAVCEAPPTRRMSLMIPARNVCPSAAWRLEYKGYLMATKWDHKSPSQYICMDYDMEIAPGSSANVNGALLYMVESRCLAGGGLPCGPYVAGWELTCAVCTK